MTNITTAEDRMRESREPSKKKIIELTSCPGCEHCLITTDTHQRYCDAHISIISNPMGTRYFCDNYERKKESYEEIERRHI